jgi:molybdopterin molybdotransferase
MISVEEAQARLLALARPVAAETVSLSEASGRVLAADVVAVRDQPPFAASAMDGYAVRMADVAPGARLRVVGEAVAGRRSPHRVGAGEAVRIFTGAPIPDGADGVVIQEDVARQGDEVTVLPGLGAGTNLRAAGCDFPAGARLPAPRRLGAADVALAAAMGAGEVRVLRRPEVAILSTGDELVMPGEAPGPDQIFASNIFGLKAMVEAAGGRARLLPPARDTEASLGAMFDLATGADVVLTVGGASVGEHDLVARVATARGVEMAFQRIAMRPGKPLMSGRLGEAVFLGLPGNPVSALVCGVLFLVPLLRALQGDPAPLPAPHVGRLGAALGANGPRAHYMRARLDGDTVTPFDRQDSALLTVLAAADALLVRPVADPPRAAGDTVTWLPLRP